ncbi:diamond [Haematobia irritans]|uniref:diamond n=1 Tax=Haematobia irritans TaxID=7368 RepID=UPI003F5088A5
MKLELKLSPQLADELKQKKAARDSLINKILYSKRLLVDHVEALEQCMVFMQQQPIPPSPKESDQSKDTTDFAGRIGRATSSIFWPEIFTARNTCLLLGSTVLEHFITPRAMRLVLVPSAVVAGGFSALYAVKKVFGFRNRIVERELENLIRTIDDFGNCIRRNMTYFNEIIIMKQHELIESRQIERAWDCITAAKEVTEILFEATRKLEAQYPIPARFTQYYAPMEDLKECDYFKNNVTDYSPKHIKDFHNIFAYVQSQFLLRLALTIATKPSLSQLNEELKKIDCLIRQLVLEEENHFKNLAIEQNKKKSLELEELNASRVLRTRNDPVGILQDSSLKLSARMVAVAGECQALDITLQRLTETENVKKDNAKHLVEVANNMRSIENALSLCFDDFQRLMLVYNKFLTSKLDLKDHSEKGDNKSHDEEFPENFLRVDISQNTEEGVLSDDFYAYMFDENQAKIEQEQLEKEQLEQRKEDLEILNFEKRITKGRFKPVLKQLKGRIDPIRKVMLEKEREVLAAKGINVDELFDNNEEETTDDENKCFACSEKTDVDNATDGESEGSADLEFERRTKKLKERDNFAEMRNFLAQKQPINLFKLDVPLSSSNALGEEDILESVDTA